MTTISETNRMMPEDGLDRLADAEAIFLGAVGHPEVRDHVSLWGLLIPIRRAFRQYVNLRPIRLLQGLASPLAGREVEDIDLVIVRENNEGEYSEIGGRIYQGTDDEIALQEAVFTRRGVRRVVTFAFELAERRSRRLASATKSNGIVHTMPFWDEIVDDVAAAHPGVAVSQYHIDALAARFVLDPRSFDVVVGSNLFGDILSDLGAAIAGQHRPRAVGQPQPRGCPPLDVRARAWLGARHRRARRGEPDRRDLVGRDAARPPRSRRRRRRGSGSGRAHPPGRRAHARPGRRRLHHGVHRRGRRRAVRRHGPAERVRNREVAPW